MHNIINVIVHLIGVALIIYALIPPKSNDDGTLERIALLLGFLLLGVWALLNGVAYNLRSLFALILEGIPS